MARTYYSVTNVTTFDNAADTLANDVFISKIGIDGGTAGNPIVILDKNNNLVFRWTVRSGGESELLELKKKVQGIKFSSITGTVIIYGDVSGIPADI